MSHLKMGLMGLPGSGKTFTAASVAIGLVQHLAKKKLEPKQVVAFVDTEGGSDWVASRFDAAGIGLQIARTRALADMGQAIDWAEQHADVLIIDSVTHFWTGFVEEYQKKKGRARVEIQDWGVIKREWRQNFIDRFLNAKLHIVMCGRQAFEYDTTERDDGKKEHVKGAARMAAEGHTGYEPDILAIMEARQKQAKGKVAGIENFAVIIKDRSATLHGQTLSKPDFRSFAPHIERLKLGGGRAAIDQSRDSRVLFAEDGDTRWDKVREQKEIALDEIREELVRKWPSQSTADKTAKADLLEHVFGTRSWTAVEALPLPDLIVGRDTVWRGLRGHGYGQRPEQTEAAAAPLDDEIPDFDGREAQP